MDFWNEIATDKSREVLFELIKEFKVIIIGGWACYLHTKTIKSKDVDVIADFKALEKLRLKYALKKNERLKKYEIKIDEIDIDIYVPFYSKFILPIEEIQKNISKIEGIAVPKPEILLLLKQEAEKEREHSVKGQKDRVDILNLLINSKINWKNYNKLTKDHNLEDFLRRLKKIVSTAKKEFDYLEITNPRKIKLIKKELLEEIETQGI